MKKVLILIGIVLFSVALKGQEVSGTWMGVGVELKVVFHVVKSGDRYITTMDSPNQEAKNWHVTSKELPGLNHLFQACEKGTVV